jgi:Terpene cyclase DEP1
MRIRVLALFTIVGFVVPNTMVAVFLAEHGVHLGLYLEDWFASLPAAQLVADLLVTCLAFICWSAWDGPRTGVRNWWVTIPATLLVGICFAAPLYLLMRERALATAAKKERPSLPPRSGSRARSIRRG